MKPLRLILPITLFILSGVLAMFAPHNLPYHIDVLVGSTIISLYLGFWISLLWALGGFDD